VSFHGIALNVAPDLADFDLIDACGEPGTISTSIAAEGGQLPRGSGTAAVAHAATLFAQALAQLLGAERPPDLAPPVDALAELELLVDGPG
jgi:lipoate-protein ligase B